MLLRGDKDQEHYKILEVLPIKYKYYSFTTVPVCAFITPMSLIYADDNNDIVVRFKKEILAYAEGFEDKPLEQGDMPEFLYELLLEKYQKHEPVRRMTYAAEKYKNDPATKFEVATIGNKKLKELLDSNEYMEEVFSFTAEMDDPLFNADAYWYPINIDTVFSGFTDRSMKFWNNAVLATFNGKHIYGYLGYNSVFYGIDFHNSKNAFTNSFSEKDICRVAYQLNPVDNTVYKFKTIPEWMKKCNVFSTPLFLKNYIVLPDNTCVDYDDKELPDKTLHYKNVCAMNKLIQLFLDQSTEDYQVNNPHLEIKVPNCFDNLTLDMIDNLIFPMLKSSNCLDQAAVDDYLRLREMFIRIGLTTDFSDALTNISEVNHEVSDTALCSDDIFNIMCSLEKEMDNNTEFIALLNNLDRLREVI